MLVALDVHLLLMLLCEYFDRGPEPIEPGKVVVVQHLSRLKHSFQELDSAFESSNESLTNATSSLRCSLVFVTRVSSRNMYVLSRVGPADAGFVDTLGDLVVNVVPEFWSDAFKSQFLGLSSELHYGRNLPGVVFWS